MAAVAVCRVKLTPASGTQGPFYVLIEADCLSAYCAKLLYDGNILPSLQSNFDI